MRPSNQYAPPSQLHAPGLAFHAMSFPRGRVSSRQARRKCASISSMRAVCPLRWAIATSRIQPRGCTAPGLGISNFCRTAPVYNALPLRTGGSSPRGNEQPATTAAAATKHSESPVLPLPIRLKIGTSLLPEDDAQAELRTDAERIRIRKIGAPIRIAH